MKNKVLSAMVLVLGLSVTAGMADARGSSVESGREKAAVCMGCHGQDGNSPADLWPKIAGQVPEYFIKQLLDFKAGRRVNDQMAPPVEMLSEQDIRDLAAFFATQRASAVEEVADRKVAHGERIYLKGAGRGPAAVTACVGCHGQRGEGSRNWSNVYVTPPAVLAPAIGSQHPSYIAAQLRAYKARTRKNDVGEVMRTIASRMSDEEIEAVAAYVATLRP